MADLSGWLKKFGQAVAIGGGIVTGFGPLIAQIIPGTKDDRIITKATDSLVDIAEIVKQVEIFGASLSLAGPDKLKAAIPSISQIIMRSAIMGGVPPGNKVEFDAGIVDLVNAMVRLQNSRGD